MRAAIVVVLATVFASAILAATPQAARAQVARAQVARAQSLKRWGILASGIPDASLSDLVTAEMGRITDVELVEREKLRLVTNEQILSLLTTEKADGRPKVGRILQADALVLLSTETPDKTLVLKVAIVECKYGARLHTTVLPYRPDGLETMATAVAQSVSSTRQRLAGGVRWLATVPHFISRDFTHQFDSLQTSCATVIESALAKLPGVAIVETEEAQSIRRELETAGGELHDRAVPLLIEGEYETFPPIKESAARVQFFIRIRNGKQVAREIKLPPAELQSAGGLLSRVVREEIIPSADLDPELLLSPKQQVAALTARAAAFSEVGSWKHATGLREAAVLLDPNAAEQRLLLVQEYFRIIKQLPWGGANRQSRQAALPSRIEIWRTGLGHLQYLIRNRQISLDEGPDLTAKFLRAFEVFHDPKEEFPFDYYRETTRFLRDVAPFGEALPRDGLAAPFPLKWRLERWWGMPLHHATHWAFDPRAKDDYRTRFAFLLEVLEQGVPEDALPGSELGYRLVNDYSENRDLRLAYFAFLQQLAQSKRQINTLCGRFGLLMYDYLPQPSATPQRLAELDALAAICDRLNSEFLKTTVPGAGERNGGLDYVEGRISYYRTLIQKQLSSVASKSLPSVPSRSPDAGLGRLRFEPLELTLKPLAGSGAFRNDWKWRTHSGWGHLSRWTACGPGLDVVWNPGAILFMHEPGLLEEVFVDPTPVFEDLRWDGRHIWIATQHQGVWIVDPSGKIVARITEQDGLPPVDRGVLLHVLSEGRLAAVGAFGEHHRTWCAILHFDRDKPGINVFHRAAFVPPDDPKHSQENERNLQTVFEPSWMHVYQPQIDGASPRLLIGRRWFPLSVNLKTMEVSSYPAEPLRGVIFPGTGIGRRSESYLSCNGKLLVAGTRSVGIYELDTDGVRFKCLQKHDGADPHAAVFPHEGWLYYAGYRWSRFDPQTFSEQKLTDGDRPQKYFGQRAGPSSHYGIVSLNGNGSAPGNFFRVHIQEGSSSDAAGKN